MHARERVGPPGMACALGSPGVQGSSAVTLNQNRRLPFEHLKGREDGWTNKHQGGHWCLAWPRALVERSHTCLQHVCVCFRMRKVEVVYFSLPPLLPAFSVTYLPQFSLSQTLSLSFMNNLFSLSLILSVGLSAFQFTSSCSQFNLTALWQSQIYDLRNEARLSQYMARCAPKQPDQFFPYLPCSSPVLCFYHHPRGHKWPTTQVTQATINAKPL